MACVLMFSGWMRGLGANSNAAGMEATASLGAATTVIGQLAAGRREWLILEALTAATQAVTGPALALAGLFEGEDPDVLVALAVHRFRCIDWDILQTVQDIMISGRPVDGTGAELAPPELYNLSQPCRVTECDAFLSHSWHDDGRQKWSALSEWCEAFRIDNARPPRLWVDKFCIDQADIKADLRCLPIFLAGCNQLLIVAGSTYHTRLWCCVELFVEASMRIKIDDDTREPPAVIFLGTEDDQHQVQAEWENFDATACNCFDARDKERMLAVMHGHAGGIRAFNAYVQEMVRDFFNDDLKNSVAPQESFCDNGLRNSLAPEVSTDDWTYGRMHGRI